ncbi:MAG: hypothetical protein LBL39_00430 [Planctomycetaceae bacterium]|nr:hypothetical protein [Planctomycetaceae bacterium]
MSIQVVCPGCMKRLKVSDKFAGMKGPCPLCKTIINIPAASVKIHGTDETGKGQGVGGKNATGQPSVNPISRIDFGFDVKEAQKYVFMILGVFLFAFLAGFIIPRGLISNILGVIGLCVVAFPISILGYHLLRNRDELFVITGMDLYKTTGAGAFVYVFVWVMFEIFLWYMSADNVFVWVYFAAFAVFAMLLGHAILDVTFGNSALHFLIFSFAVIILRGISGIGWLWNTTAIIDTSPILPGM